MDWLVIVIGKLQWANRLVHKETFSRSFTVNEYGRCGGDRDPDPPANPMNQIRLAYQLDKSSGIFLSEFVSLDFN